MTDLSEFLLARLDEWQAAARAALRRLGSRHARRPRTVRRRAHQRGAHDPARVLAQVAAMREIVELHDHDNAECFEMHRGVVASDWPEGDGRIPGEPWAHSSLELQEGPCPTLRALASIWADADGYDPNWRLG